MWDVNRRFHLALSDLGRRAGLAVAGGVLMAVGAGFLLAALWSWLAHGLGWGPAAASLAVAGLCLLAALGLLLAARRARHAMPGAGDVRAEAEARARLATQAAVGAVKTRAEQARNAAGQHLQGFLDRGRYQADRAASGLDAAAEKVAEKMAGGSPGPMADPVAEAMETARGMAEQFARSRAAPGVALVSAFAIGLALANLFGSDEDA